MCSRKIIMYSQPGCVECRKAEQIFSMFDVEVEISPAKGAESLFPTKDMRGIFLPVIQVSDSGFKNGEEQLFSGTEYMEYVDHLKALNIRKKGLIG